MVTTQTFPTHSFLLTQFNEEIKFSRFEEIAEGIPILSGGQRVEFPVIQD